MLYVVGTRSSRVARQLLPGITCAHCRVTGSVWAAVFARYFFIGFIPAFPTGKTAVTECGHCQQVLTGLPQMPPAYRPPVQTLLASARTPVTHFMFPILVAAIAVLPFLFTGGLTLLSYLGFFKPAVRTDLPREVVGNRYVYRFTAPVKGYTLVEATRVTDDSVYCFITGGLRGPLTPATATVALRDSVGPVRGFTLGEWQMMVGPQSQFKKL